MKSCVSSITRTRFVTAGLFVTQMSSGVSQLSHSGPSTESSLFFSFVHRTSFPARAAETTSARSSGSDWWCYLCRVALGSDSIEEQRTGAATHPINCRWFGAAIQNAELYQVLALQPPKPGFCNACVFTAVSVKVSVKIETFFFFAFVAIVTSLLHADFLLPVTAEIQPQPCHYSQHLVFPNLPIFTNYHRVFGASFLSLIWLSVSK